jgi:hypothetical protein
MSHLPFAATLNPPRQSFVLSAGNLPESHDNGLMVTIFVSGGYMVLTIFNKQAP